MKKWTVIVQYTAHQNCETVVADYLKHEGGALIFKREVRHTYPEVVVMYAPGRWLEVTKES